MPDITSLLPFVFATVIGSVVAVVGAVAARRAGLGPIQNQYVETLEGNNTALVEKVNLLVESLEREKKARVRLAQKLIRLERTVIALAEENDTLRKRLKLPTRNAAGNAALARLGSDEDIDLTDPDLGELLDDHDGL